MYNIALWCNGNTDGFGPSISGSNPDKASIRKIGRVWFIASLLKSEGLNGSVGSNPTSSSTWVCWCNGNTLDCGSSYTSSILVPTPKKWKSKHNGTAAVC